MHIFPHSILLFCDNVIMSFSGPRGRAFEGDKNGRLYLTTHRMAFTNKNNQDEMKSFSFPFVALRNVELEQPVFGSNYIKGKILAQANGGMYWFQAGLHWGARGGGRPPRICPCMKRNSRKFASRKYKKLPYVGFAPPD